jgi:hypothetical protein
MAFLLIVIILAGALPVAASEAYFEGQTEPPDGKQGCSGSSLHVRFQVTPDGEVLGGAVTLQMLPGDESPGGAATPISSDGFHATLEPNGRLQALFHAGRHAELVAIDGSVSGDRFEGIVRRADCRYRLIMKRR